jgi:hypothetical protein
LPARATRGFCIPILAIFGTILARLSGRLSGSQQADEFPHCCFRLASGFASGLAARLASGLRLAFASRLVFALGLAFCAIPTSLWAQQAQTPPPGKIPASIHGVVLDRDKSLCQGAHVTLTRSGLTKTVLSDEQGRYVFGNVPAGPFQITVSADGFTAQTVSGQLAPGESRELEPVVLLITSSSRVEVSADIHEIAEAQIEQQEKQRILGIVPNFYVSYAKDAVPLTARQKFQLAWHNELDPMTFITTGAGATVEQAQDTPKSWGQGGASYGKRFAAGYGDDLLGTALGSALLPVLLHQDPRYFYKGTGTKTARVLYAIRSSVICRGDNGRWQFNYSGIGGGLAAGGLSNLYYPAADRDGFGLTMRNMGIGIVESAVTNIFQEFVVRRLTPRLSKNSLQQP